MLKREKQERGVVEFVDMESLIPQDHLLRKVDRAVDFRKIYEIVEPLCGETDGRPGEDPVVLFKIVLLHLDGTASLRGTLRRAQTDIAYRWFLGYKLNEELPHFSTVSYNFQHRFTEETIDAVFQMVFGDNRVLSTAYKRPMTMKGGHEWWKYVYDEHYDCIICPEYQPLAYRTTIRDGYREYCSDS